MASNGMLRKTSYILFKYHINQVRKHGLFVIMAMNTIQGLLIEKGLVAPIALT
jgi:hypothetical protein